MGPTLSLPRQIGIHVSIRSRHSVCRLVRGWSGAPLTCVSTSEPRARAAARRRLTLRELPRCRLKAAGFTRHRGQFAGGRPGRPEPAPDRWPNAAIAHRVEPDATVTTRQTRATASSPAQIDPVLTSYRPERGHNRANLRRQARRSPTTTRERDAPRPRSPMDPPGCRRRNTGAC